MPTDKDQPDNPNLSDEMNAKGIDLADRGWLDEAARYFRKAIDLDANASHAWDNLAGVLAEKGVWREALAAYLRSLELEPGSAAGHFNLASFLLRYGLQMAEAELREALTNDPEYPDARLSLGIALADMGRVDEAMAELTTAMDLDPEDPYPRHEMALLLMDENDVRGAIGLLRDVVRLEPENVEAHLDLGACYTRKGFFAEAERALLTALQLRPGHIHGLYGLASLYAMWSKDEQAIERAREAHDRDPEKVRAWLVSDPAFEQLRDTPQIEALLEE